MVNVKGLMGMMEGCEVVGETKAERGVVMLDNAKDNKRWYTDADINCLLQYYFANHPEVEIATALLGTDWHGKDGSYNILNDNLHSIQQQRSLDSAKSKNKMIVPINLYNNHWALLYILYNETSSTPATVYYFEPFGQAINTEVSQAVSNAFPQAEIIDIGARTQDDGYNCGPWIVEAARAFVHRGQEPNGDIHQARQEHQGVLAQFHNKPQAIQPGFNHPTTIANELLLSQEEIAPRIKALADRVSNDANASVQDLKSLKTWVKESDSLLRSQYSFFRGLDRIERNLPGFNKDLISEQYLTNSKVDETQDADYLLSRALQNAEISDFLSQASKLKRS